MSQYKAIYYGQVQLIPGIICDGYVLNDANNTAVMSERGTALLLGMAHTALQNVATNGVPKSLKSFVTNNLSVATTSVEVAALNSPHKNRKIVVYQSDVIECLIRAYTLAVGYNTLHKNQIHIGRRCIVLFSSLAKTALDAAIKEACGFAPDVQKTAQSHYSNALEQIQQWGFKCSVGNDIAIKKDITSFLKVPQSTLNSFLAKHSYEIKPIKLGRSAIQSIGSRSSRMNGYYLDDVVKIIFGMDSEVTVALKREIFGDLATFTKMDSKAEIAWREVLRKVFAGFEMKTNHPIGEYRYFIDYFIPELMLCLEENGYNCHRHYNQEEETKREQVITQKYALIRFHHKISLEVLVNAILKAKPGDIIKLYEIEPSFDFSKN